MKNIKFIISMFLIIALTTSCYEDYIMDNEVRATYFSSQKPLRTIVPRNNSAEIEVGVVLSGLRDDSEAYTVDFIVDTILLDTIPEAADLILMPSEYYTIGGTTVDYSTADNNVMTFDIVKPFLRTINVTFDVEKFTSDPLALGANYAIPLRIVSTSVDSIINFGEVPTIESGDISILVVKYFSPYSGEYYSKGTQVGLDAIGGTPDTSTLITYSFDDLSANDHIRLSTIGLDEVETSRIGKNVSGNWNIEINDDGSLNVTSSDVDNVTVNSATFNVETNTFNLDIDFEDFGWYFNVKEELILVQEIENELRREEW